MQNAFAASAGWHEPATRLNLLRKLCVRLIATFAEKAPARECFFRNLHQVRLNLPVFLVEQARSRSFQKSQTPPTKREWVERPLLCRFAHLRPGGNLPQPH